MSEDVQQLRAQLEQLQARVEELSTATPTGGAATATTFAEKPVARRNMLRTLGVATAGAAVGGLALAQPAAAIDGDTVLIGAQRTSDTPTGITTNPGYTASPLVGAFHVTNDATKANANAAFSCISAIATGSGGGQQTVAFFGAGSSIGAKLDGPVPLKLTDSTNSAAPVNTSGLTGQFKVSGGDLWYCAFGESGVTANKQWRRLAGPTTTGAFVAVTPTRVYDSRFADGALTSNTNRVVPIFNAINVDTGATTTANFVPAGAQAIAFTLTIVGATSSGYVFAAPGDAAAVTASTINWGPVAPAALANSTVSKVNAARQLKIFLGGAADASSQVIVDVLGYYL